MNETVNNVRQALADIDELWSPRPLARINDYAVKAVRVQGEFVWHRHTATDELFLVVSGELDIDLRDAGGERRVSLSAEDVFVCRAASITDPFLATARSSSCWSRPTPSTPVTLPRASPPTRRTPRCRLAPDERKSDESADCRGYRSDRPGTRAGPELGRP